MWIFEARIQTRTHGLSADVFLVHVWTFYKLVQHRLCVLPLQIVEK